MKISVWDTYVKREDGKVMHFDILVPKSVTDEKTIFGYGKAYLKTKPFLTNHISANECRLCHIEEAIVDIISLIKQRGYSIIEIENCS